MLLLIVYNWVVYVLQHWVRLEIQSDILIHRLYMKVDPADSSYMPSLIVVSAGDTLNNMKEVRTVNIPSTESLVTIIQDINDVCV